MSKKKRDASNISDLSSHKRNRKRLEPPFSRIPNIHMSSWRNDRLPEVLWAALIAGNMERNACLQYFRVVAESARQLGSDRVVGIDHSDIGRLDEESFDAVFGEILSDSEIKEILAPLLFYEHLPGRPHWARHLPQCDPEAAFQLLATAISKSFDHQSEAATDCRWLRILVKLLIGQLIFAPQLQHLAEEILFFPNKGDMRKVRPSIRASEGSMEPDDLTWCHNFWDESFRNTSCISLDKKKQTTNRNKELIDSFSWLYACVSNHFHETATTTEINPRLDAVFGITLYALRIATMTISRQADESPEGRTALRSIVELYITLAYLLKIDSKTVWERYRRYGVGQAKLAFLKLFDLDDDEVPPFVDIDRLEQLANEDMWQEFESIDLGSWSGVDLRKMSEEANCKTIYDKYYIWPSGFVHGHWGSIRDSVFETCLNPLHRYHRIPTNPFYPMPSVLSDISKLINMILDRLNYAFPAFKERVGALPTEDDLRR